MNYTADFLWLGHCKGKLATSLRLRGAALKAFVEVGTSSAVRAVLQRASRADSSGLREELGGDLLPEQIRMVPHGVLHISDSSGQRRQTTTELSHVRPQRCACLPEVCLDWVKDFGVCRNELAGVKSQFKTLVQIEIASGQIAAKSPTEAWIKCPPVRLKHLADGAVASYRSLLRQRYDAIAVGSTHSGIKQTGKRLRSQSSESISDEEDDILKISEVMRAAGVWTAVWSSFRSDLANQMLSLKCAETDGSFSGRRQETVQGHIPVLVHKYKKSSDWPLAWRALQNTRDVYQKRVREFLESMYLLAGYPADRIEHVSAELARAIAVSLRVMPSSN